MADADARPVQLDLPIPPEPGEDPAIDLATYDGPLLGLRPRDRELVLEVCAGLRRLLARRHASLRPVELHHLARLLAALERLPYATPGFGLSLSLSCPQGWGTWCTLELGASHLELTHGTSIPFFAGIAERDVYVGSLTDWLGLFDAYVEEGPVELTFEESGDPAAPAWPPLDGMEDPDPPETPQDPWKDLEGIEWSEDEDLWEPGVPLPPGF